MASPMFNAFGNANNLGNMGNMLARFQQFRQSFTGDPRQQVQQLLNSGRVSQAQYNQAVQMANAFQQMLK